MALRSKYRCTRQQMLPFQVLMCVPYEAVVQKRHRLSTKINAKSLPKPPDTSHTTNYVRTGRNSKAASFPRGTTIFSLQQKTTVRPGGKDPIVEKGPVKVLSKKNAYQPRHFQKAKRYLDNLLRYEGSPEKVNATWQIFDRLVSETSCSKGEQRYHWFCETDYLNAHLKKWQNAALHPGPCSDVLSPQVLLEKILNWSKKLPHMQHDAKSLNILFETVFQLQYSSCQDLIAAVEGMFDALDSSSGVDSSSLSTAIYNCTLRAHKDCAFPGTSTKIEAIYDKMRQSSSATPNEETYSILMDFLVCNLIPEKVKKESSEMNAQRHELSDEHPKKSFAVHSQISESKNSIDVENAEQGIIDSIDGILEAMKHAWIEPSIRTSLLALKGYAMSGKINIAEAMLLEMIEKVNKDETKENVNCVPTGARYILEGLCHEVVTTTSTQDVKYILQRAHKIFKAVENISSINPSSEEMAQMESTMVKLFASVDELENVEILLAENAREYSPTIIQCLIELYSDKDMAMQATKLVEHVLTCTSITPKMPIFHAVLNAWAKSSQDDSVAQAFSVLRLMKNDPKCTEIGVKPDAIVYETLWKCFAKQTTSENKGKFTQEIMSELERIEKTGYMPGPDEKLFKVLIQMALIVANDLRSIDNVFRHLIMSGIKIDANIFNEILQQQMGEHPDGKAQLREHILWKMRQIVEPNLSCFNTVLRSWCHSGSPDAAERSWHIFRHLISLRMQPDHDFLTKLILFLSSTGDLKMLNRAEYLLKKINDNGFPGVSPDLRFFIAVTKGWINIGHTQRAEKLLFLRNDLYMEKKMTKLMPIPVNYDVIMHSYIKVGKIFKATKFINKLDDLVKQKQLSVAPELRTYRSLLNAWKRWSKSYRAEKRHHISQLETKIARLVKNS